MLSMLRPLWRRRGVLPGEPETSAVDADQAATCTAILRLIETPTPDGRVYQIRDLHGATGLLQRDILRAVEELRKQEKITLDGGQFDPLSAIIRAA